jgi:integrase
MGRKATGTAVFESGKWWARITLADGSRSPLIELEPEKYSARRFPPKYDENGKLIVPERIKLACEARSEAERRDGKLLAIKLAGLAAAKGPTVTGPTVSAYFDSLYDHKAAKGLTTTKEMRARFRNWIEPEIGSLFMREITPEDLARVVRRLDAAAQERNAAPADVPERRRPGISWKTAWNVWSEVTSGFYEAHTSKVEALRVREGNPAADVQGPDRGIQREKPILFPSEVVALLSCTKVPLQRRRVYAVAIYTGARSNELAALATADIDLEHMRISISKQRDRRTGDDKPTKTRRARVIEVEQALAPLLEILVREARAAGRKTLLKLPPDEDRAELLRETDLPAAGCTRPDLYVDDAARAPIKFHQLRDTCLTHMGVRGDDPLSIQWRAGHTDFAMTQKYVDQGRKLRSGFGTPFPPLPPSLLGEETSDQSSEPPTSGDLDVSKRVEPDHAWHELLKQNAARHVLGDLQFPLGSPQKRECETSRESPQRCGLSAFVRGRNRGADAGHRIVSRIDWPAEKE